MRRPGHHALGRRGLGPQKTRNDHRLGGMNSAFPEPPRGGERWTPELDDRILEDYLGAGRRAVRHELEVEIDRTLDAIRRRLWGLSCRYRLPRGRGYQAADYQAGPIRLDRTGLEFNEAEYHLVYWSFGKDGVESGGCCADWIAGLVRRPALEVAHAVHDRLTRDYEYFKSLVEQAGQSRLMTPEEAQRAKQGLLETIAARKALPAPE